jgi:hypothetical protein
MTALKTTGVALLWVLIIAAHICTFAYFVPMHVALQRKVKDASSIAVINVLLGWTIIGWAVALSMSLRDRTARAIDAAPLFNNAPVINVTVNK